MVTQRVFVPVRGKQLLQNGQHQPNVSTQMHPTWRSMHRSSPAVYLIFPHSLCGMLSCDGLAGGQSPVWNETLFLQLQNEHLIIFKVRLDMHTPLLNCDMQAPLLVCWPHVACHVALATDRFWMTVLRSAVGCGHACELCLLRWMMTNCTCGITPTTSTSLAVFHTHWLSAYLDHGLGVN